MKQDVSGIIQTCSLRLAYSGSGPTFGPFIFFLQFESEGDNNGAICECTGPYKIARQRNYFFIVKNL